MSRKLDRRDVLKGALAAAAFAAVPGCGGKTEATTEEPKPPPVPKQKILILGGTGFLGPKTIEAALARGHEVTIFNRGKREKLAPLELPVEHLYGNRDPELPADDEKGPDGKLVHPNATPKGLEQLKGRSWDVVIDNSGFYPRHVKASADLLAPSCKQYIYISSISAYGKVPPTGGNEDAELATLEDPTVETMGDQFQHYGGLKVLCEKAVQAAFGERATIVRPGFIVGPGDPTDRFTYWPVRIAKGGDVLAPGAPDDPLQWIDVRDLGEWLVKLTEDSTFGVFNAIGPTTPARWGDVLDTCVKVSASSAKLTWVPTDWLNAKTEKEPVDFPIWVPPMDDYAGFHRWNTARPVAAGLQYRPLADTIKALLEWWPVEVERRVKVTAELVAKKPDGPPMPDPKAMRAGPKAEQEAALLAAYAQSPTTPS